MKDKYVSDTCDVACINNNKEIIAEVMNFQEKKFLTVTLNRSIKLDMKWNGMVYEANSAGMTFTSDGPTILLTKPGRK